MAKKTKNQQKNRSSNRSSRRRDYSGNNSQAHRGYPKVRSLVRLLQGRGSKDNVGCGCKTAKSAMRYMHLLKASLRSDYLPKRL